jgi:hypothetical protein
MKPVALALGCLMLASCAKPSSPTHLPPSLCAEVRPEPVIPNGAGIVQPVTEAEVEAVAGFLGWVSEALDWGRENAARAETARRHCRPHDPG